MAQSESGILQEQTAAAEESGMSPFTGFSIATVAVVSGATYTDLRRRRIPNLVTFPAVVFALAAHFAVAGWRGAVISTSGALLAPALLSILHRGKGLGAGDIKLASAVGALMGPPLAVVAMLLSAVAGGVLATFWALRACGVFEFGRSRSGTHASRAPEVNESVRSIGTLAIPYGVAIAIGSIATLGVSLCTGFENWLFWCVTAGGTPS